MSFGVEASTKDTALEMSFTNIAFLFIFACFGGLFES